jgi:hypothetical protein
MLEGMKANLYKCFLPQSWKFKSEFGVAAFIHPDGVFDDPQGGMLRQKLYPLLRAHFQFANEKKLFAEVDHHTTFSLNVYAGLPRSLTNDSIIPTMHTKTRGISFDTISNLYDAGTIDQCYDGSISGEVPGIKNDNNDWNTKGHPNRIVKVTKKELQVFAKLFDGNSDWQKARIPAIHARTLMDVLVRFFVQNKTIKDHSDNIYSTVMWSETSAQSNGTIIRNVHFPETAMDMICSGPHIGVANPLFKCSRRICKNNSDYDIIDLINVPEKYLQRCNYSPSRDIDEYQHRIPTTQWNRPYTSFYRICVRRMLNQSGERTLISAIMPPKISHIHPVLGLVIIQNITMIAGLLSSVPFDFFIKTSGRSDVYYDTLEKLPLIDNKWRVANISLRSLLLNCITIMYSELYIKEKPSEIDLVSWSKFDSRLRPEKMTSLTKDWTWDTPLRTDYERRQALVEIDVLTAQALGMTLEQLRTIYRIQFPVLQSYEADTWYDRNGRIVFTNNRSLTGVGYSRLEWDQIKDAPSGTFTRTITDDTQPGGPVERMIEYVAPFDRCDREQDYEIAWKFFEEKYSTAL